MIGGGMIGSDLSAAGAADRGDYLAAAAKLIEVLTIS
jgi:hypothetical protein